MTEQEWLTSNDPAAMLQLLQGFHRPVSETFTGRLRICTDRKLRLFACACCRLAWHRLNAEGKRRTEMLEAIADGCEFDDELALQDVEPVALARTESSVLRHIVPWATQAALLRDIFGNVYRPMIKEVSNESDIRVGSGQAIWSSDLGDSQSGRGESSKSYVGQRPALPQCHQFGDKQGCSREVATWLSWNDRTVPRIAQAIYDERAFDRMPILADGLEEAGCEDEAMLRHCRGEEPLVCSRDCGMRHHRRCALAGGDNWIALRGPQVRGCWVLDLVLGKE